MAELDLDVLIRALRATSGKFPEQHVGMLLRRAAEELKGQRAEKERLEAEIERLKAGQSAPPMTIAEVREIAEGCVSAATRFEPDTPDYRRAADACAAAYMAGRLDRNAGIERLKELTPPSSSPSSGP